MSVSSSGENVAVVAAAAELRQMSSCQNPAYGRLANFDIDRKVSFAYNQWKDSDQMTHFVQGTAFFIYSCGMHYISFLHYLPEGTSIWIPRLLSLEKSLIYFVLRPLRFWL